MNHPEDGDKIGRLRELMFEQVSHETGKYAKPRNFENRKVSKCVDVSNFLADGSFSRWIDEEVRLNVHTSLEVFRFPMLNQ